VYGGDAGVDAVVARAAAAGVSRLVTIGSGYELPCALRAAAVAERHANVWFTVGLHPHDAKHWGPEAKDALVQLASRPKCVGLGEMGLDFHYDHSPRDVQRQGFREQIRLACELGLPIVIHDRESDGETLRILVDEHAFPPDGGPGVLFHCYTGDVVAMQDIVERGGWVSIPGIVTFKNALLMRQVATQIPLDRLLIETDSPFLTPVPFRGQKNEPAHVVKVAEAIARLRDLAVEAIAAATTDNAARFFGLKAVD
jgi:TatD DNase family protein